MKKIITSIFIGLIAAGSYAQMAVDNSIHTRTIDLNEKMLSFGLTEAQFEAIKHEAYANPEFIPGNIYQGEDAIQTKVFMRYNSFADEIEIKERSSSKDYSALRKDPDIFVKIGDDVYLYVLNERNPKESAYFNVLLAGEKYDLYKRVHSVFVEAKEAETSYQKATPPTFKKTITYYLVEDGRFFEIPNGRKKIMKMMSSKKNEMEQYVKENKLDVREEADLIQAIKHFDGLQK